MTTTKRVMAALMAATVIFITTYNTYNVSVNAAEIVVGGATVSLVELIGGFLACLGVSYLGSQVDTATMDDYKDMFDTYLDTVDGTSAVIDYLDNLPAYTVIGGNKPKPPKNPDEIRAIQATGLYFTSELISLAQDFFKYVAETDTALGNTIEEASSQDVYFVNPMLPENVYIGFNSSVIPGLAAMEGYDASLSHVQFYNTINFRGYAAGQIDYSEYNGAGSMYYNALRVDYYADQTEVRSRTQYVIGQNGKLSLFGYSNPAYIFTSAGSDLCNDGYYYNHCIVDAAHPLYLSPSATQPVIYVEGNTNYKYLVYQSGVVWDGDTSTSPSGVVTDTGALSSIKPIVGKNLSAYIGSLADKLIQPDADPAVDPVVYTPQALEEIYNNVSNYYDQTVQNYYSDPQYITENEYVTNITNIYQEAAENNPEADPVIPVTPALGDIGDYKVTGLSDVFPFCIPFDMYDLLTILAADPKAISFDYTFYFGEYFGEYTIHVDLSVFDPVAKVVRTMELLLYIFGLMLVTRNLIRG